jgi:integrase
MATFRKRNKKWQVQVRRAGLPALSKTFTNKQDAEVWANRQEVLAEQADAGQFIKPNKSHSFADLMIRYRDEVVVFKRCAEFETIMINALLRRSISKLKLHLINSNHFAEYRDERLKTVSTDIVRRELGIIQHAFQVAINEWMLPIPLNPIKRIKKPSPSKSRVRRLKEGEMEALSQSLEFTENLYLEPVIHFAIETAMRRGEILQLKWSNFDSKNSIILIEDTKNGYSRFVPLNSAATKILNSISRSGDQIFPTSASAVQQSWQRLTKRAGIIDLHFHDLRHEAISRFFEQGLSVPEVALISGHRDMRQLFRYTHLKAEDVVKKLN